MPQAVVEETSTGNITIWPLHLHPPSQLTLTLTNKHPFIPYINYMHRITETINLILFLCTYYTFTYVEIVCLCECEFVVKVNIFWGFNNTINFWVLSNLKINIFQVHAFFRLNNSINSWHLSNLKINIFQVPSSFSTHLYNNLIFDLAIFFFFF